MGSGGIIIIRQKVREPAELEIVKQNITAAERTRLQGILDKSDRDWTKADFGFVLRCINRAHDKQC